MTMDAGGEDNGRRRTLEPDERRTRFERYLLGTLDADGCRGVREQAIREAELYAELREIELDLLDTAARGALDAERTRLVRERLATLPHNRAAWDVATALAARAARTAGHAQVTPIAGVGVDVDRGRRRWRWRILTPIAAALVAGAGLATYVMRQAPATSPVDRSGPPPVAAPPLASADRPDHAGRPDRPDRASADAPASSPSPSSLSRPPASPSSPSTPARTAPPPDVAMLVVYLPSATLRGPKPVVRLPADVRTLRFEIELDPDDGRAASVGPVVVRVPGGHPLWSAARVPVATRAGRRVVTIIVPARLLPTGAAEAQVRVSGGNGAAHERLYPFLVRRE